MEMKAKRIKIEQELGKIERLLFKVRLSADHVQDAKQRAYVAVGRIRELAQEMEDAHDARA